MTTSTFDVTRRDHVTVRVPHFCAGCPHSTSTHVPAGSRAYTGIGCHYMAQWMDRSTEGYTHMGGEGANWIGEAPFSTRNHVFQNLGDGTYNHSGSLAIRFAVAAKTNITFKILYNGVVAMTGGQKHEGELTVDAIAHQMAAEGVKKIALVTDEPGKYPTDAIWPPGLTIYHRNVINEVQRELSEIEGVTVLIYDQTCATEKRRLRKRGQMPDPDARVIINELVCEGCGDCGTASNCVAVQPLETEFGRKRRIDQSACNKDFSCLEGFCPSFVTVKGGTFKKKAASSRIDLPSTLLPEPTLPALDVPWGTVVAGVGGTLPIVLAAAEAVGATPEQASSWVSGLGIATALSALVLSVRYRMPIITAWSTPGAALIASTSGIGLRAAVGAFVLSAVLILLTAAIRPLGKLIERIPASIAAAMLAGILLRLVMAMVEQVPKAPLLVLPLVALFLIARTKWPALASLVVLIAGALLAGLLGLVKPIPALGLSHLEFASPAFDVASLIGLGVPLYLVTMASQNLPGFAVLRGSGYQPPTAPVLATTGAVSLATAFTGAHTSNLAAISAALCTWPEAHPDPAQRWKTGPFYALWWGLIALFGASLVGLFGALPPALLITVAGTALLGSTAGALGSALADDKERLAAAGTLAVTVSGVSLMGVGSAFWGLVFGLLVMAAERLFRR